MIPMKDAFLDIFAAALTILLGTVVGSIIGAIIGAIVALPVLLSSWGMDPFLLIMSAFTAFGAIGGTLYAIDEL